jgi:hypothetical protein
MRVPAGSVGIVRGGRVVGVEPAGGGGVRFTWHDDGPGGGGWVERGEGDGISLVRVPEARAGGVVVRDAQLVLDRGRAAPSNRDLVAGIVAGEGNGDVRAALARGGLEDAAPVALIVPGKEPVTPGGARVEADTIWLDGQGQWSAVPDDFSPAGFQAEIAAANGDFTTATVMSHIAARGGAGHLGDGELGLLAGHGSAAERNTAIYQAVARGTGGQQMRWTQVAAWKHLTGGGDWQDLPASLHADMKTGEGKSLVNAAVAAEWAVRLAPGGGASYFATPREVLLKGDLPEIRAIAGPLGISVHEVGPDGEVPVIVAGKPVIYAFKTDDGVFYTMRNGRLPGQPEDPALRGETALHADEGDEVFRWGSGNFNIRLRGDSPAAPHEAELANMGQKVLEGMSAKPGRGRFFTGDPGGRPG